MNRFSLLVISLLIILGFCSKAEAQMMIGNSGGFNTPTAEMDPAGTFTGGITFIGNGLITTETDARNDIWRFNYNTFIYYGHFVIFDWLEATFRETLLQNTYKGRKPALREQDRSVAVKVRVLKESEKCPAIAFGVTDPSSVTGHHPFASAWLAATKNFHFNTLSGTLGVTAGYSKSWDSSIMYDGPVLNLRYRPDFFPVSSMMVEYDTQGVNYGVEAVLWKHLGVYVFAREFETISAGIRFKSTIKYRKK